MRIVIGSDHAGFHLKATIIDHVTSLGHEVYDAGSYDANPVDFPDIAKMVTSSIIEGKADRGLMVCGTGVGASIAANKVKGIRAAVCHDVHSAHQSVEHDDVNVMCIGAQIVGAWLAGISLQPTSLPNSPPTRTSGAACASLPKWTSSAEHPPAGSAPFGETRASILPC